MLALSMLGVLLGALFGLFEGGALGVVLLVLAILAIICLIVWLVGGRRRY